jgi:hypothetical protein
MANQGGDAVSRICSLQPANTAKKFAQEASTIPLIPAMIKRAQMQEHVTAKKRGRPLASEKVWKAALGAVGAVSNAGGKQ